MKTVTVRDLGKVVTGHTPPTAKREYYGNSYLFLKPTDMVIGQKYTYVTEEGYSAIGAEKYKTSLIPKGSTCVVCIGTLGEKMSMAHCDLFTNQSVNSIIPKDNYDHHYVYYLLKHNLHKLKAFNKGTASGREFVSKTTFLDIEIDVIEDIKTQKKIGEILSAYDDLIENNKKQIKLLEEMAQRLYKEWFVNLRFLGYEETPIVDGVPKGWKKGPIIRFFSTVLGGTPSREKKEYWGGDIPWINSGEVNKLRIIRESEFISELGLKKSATKLMPIHTTVLAITGATLGQVSYTEIETCANQSVVGIYDEKKAYSEYIYLVVSNEIKKIISKATGGAQQHISKDIVNKFEIILPSLEVNLQLKKIINPLFAKITKCYFAIEKLKEARDRLLPRLMSGEIEV